MKRLLISFLVVIMSFFAIGLTACNDEKKEEPATQGLVFTLIDENAYSVSGYNGSSTDVVIPANYNGKPVLAIDDFAFCQNTIIKSIKIQNSITSIGVGAFAYCTSLTNIILPNSVTSIGDNAFCFCTSLTNIVLSNSVKSIGVLSFYGCENLQYNSKDDINYLGSSQNKYLYLVGPESASITFAQIDNNCKIISELAFSECRSLKSVSMGNNVESIQSSAFAYCTALENIELPNSLKEVGETIFYDCYKLKYNEKDGVAYLGNSENKYLYLLEAISNNFTTLTIDSSCRFMNYQAFNYYDNIEKVNYLGTIDEWVQIDFSNRTANPTCIASDLYINNELVTEVVLTSATKVSSYAFFDCKSIRSVTIPNSVTSIGEDAFSGCASLASVTFEENSSLESIADGVFYDCQSLETIIIPNSVKSIGDSAFYDCSSLKVIEIPETITSIGYSVFSGCNTLQYNIEGNLKYLGNSENPYLYLAGTTSTNIISATINANCRLIGDDALYDCASLTSIIIPDSVIRIGNGAFAYCDSLISIVIPNNVTSMGYDVFWNCTALTIYCEVEHQPFSWSTIWNRMGMDYDENEEYVPVVWGYKGEN